MARQVVEMWLEFIKSGRAAADPVPAAMPPALVAPPSPPAPPSPSPPPETPVAPLAPFKIVVRDGKRVLVPMVGGDAPPSKIKRLEKPSDVVTEPVKDKIDKTKVRSTENKVVRPDSDVDKAKPISKNKHKDVHRSEGKDKEHEIKRKEGDKKEHSRSSSTSSTSTSTHVKSHKPSSSSSHSKSKESVRDKSKESSKDKHKSHTGEKSKWSKIKESRDKSRDSLKSRIHDKKDTKDSARKADKGVDLDLDDMPPRSTPAISSLGKIPKKTSASTAISAAEASATGGVLGSSQPPQPPQPPQPLPVAKKGTFSDERKRSAEVKPSERPKTVKTLPTKFRSTGLEEEAKPPPSRSEVRKKDRDGPKEVVKDLGKRSLTSSKEGKDAPPEKKPRPADPKVAHLTHLTHIKDKQEKPGGIKLIPPKPKRKYLLLLPLLSHLLHTHLACVSVLSRYIIM